MAHKWLHKVIIKPEHAKELEAEAAFNEFGPHKMPRDVAEDVAYNKYRNKHHQEAAIHHLKGMRRSVSNGDSKDAEKHHTLYKMHVKAMGLNPNSPAPASLSVEANKPDDKESHVFTHHSADSLIMAGPMNKSEREATGFWGLSKDDSPKSPEHNSDSPKPPPTPKPDTAATSTEVKNVKVKGLDHVEYAGPQHFNKGSTVIYNQGQEGVGPSDWIGTVVAHHMIKLHGIHEQGRKHFYECQFRTPDGKVVEDFVNQEKLLPYKGKK